MACRDTVSFDEALGSVCCHTGMTDVASSNVAPPVGLDPLPGADTCWLDGQATSVAPTSGVACAATGSGSGGAMTGCGSETGSGVGAGSGWGGAGGGGGGSLDAGSEWSVLVGAPTAQRGVLCWRKS